MCRENHLLKNISFVVLHKSFILYQDCYNKVMLRYEEKKQVMTNLKWKKIIEITNPEF